MKKTLALVLALAMVFSTITVAFAEDTIGADAQSCTNLGMLVGEGNGVNAAYLAQTPTRMQAAIMLLRLKGLYDEAIAFTGTENFSDGNMAWAGGKNLLAYLKAHPEVGFNGNPDGTFAPEGKMTAQAYYKVMLVALGYTENLPTVVGDFTWESVIEFAAGKGLTKVAAVTNFTVNDLATATVEALKANVKDGSKTLVASLIESGKVDKTKAIADGLYVDVAAVNAELKAAKAVANNKVEVEFTAEVAKAFAENAANFKVVVKGSTTALEVKSAILDSAKKVVLETAAQTAGTAYTVTVGEISKNFAGLGADKNVPKISSVECSDTNTVDVTFDKMMDKETATNIANYTLNNSATVKAAALSSSRKVVTLTTEGVAKNKVYNLKVENVKSSDLVAIKSVTKSFTGKTDTTAPKIDSIDNSSNNIRVIVNFTDDHGVDKASAETLENYAIVSGSTTLEIKGIIAKDADDDDYYDQVEISTAAQENGAKYTLKINNLVDGSVSANKITKELTKDFRGKKADSTSPKVARVTFINDDKLEVVFDETNRLDPATLTDVANYTIDSDIAVKAAVLRDAEDLDSADGKTVILTTSAVDAGDWYKITVANIADEFGNVITKVTKSTRGIAEDVRPPFVQSIKAISPTVFRVTFDNRVDEASAEDATNYVLNKDMGAALKAVLNPDDDGSFNVVEVTVPTLTVGTTYKVTMDNIKDENGNTLSAVAVSFVATDDEIDTDRPELEAIEAAYNNVLRLTFDEEVEAQGAYVPSVTVTYTPVGGVLTTGILNMVGNTLEDGLTVEFLAGDADIVTGGVQAFVLDPRVEYTITRVDAVQDVNGNMYVAPTGTDAKTFDGESLPNPGPEVDSWEQVDSTTFRVYFNEPVLAGAAQYTTVAVADDLTLRDTFDVAVDPDADGDDAGNSTVDFTVDNGIVEAEEVLGFNFSAIITDYAGRPAVDADDEVDQNEVITTNTYTEIESYIDDEDGPVIETVEPTNIHEIEVTYNENIDTARPGSYRITWTDEDDDVQTVTQAANGVSADDNVVTIELTNNAAGTLDPDVVYTLEPITPAYDMAGNRADVKDAEVDFVGTDVMVQNYIKGVKVVNAKQIVVSVGQNIADGTAVSVTRLDAAGRATTDVVTVAGTVSSTLDTTTSQTVNLVKSLLTGTNYRVAIGALDYDFEGVAGDGGIELQGADVVFSDWNTEDYVVKVVYDADGVGGAAAVTYTLLPTQVDDDGVAGAPVVSNDPENDTFTLGNNLFADVDGADVNDELYDNTQLNWAAIPANAVVTIEIHRVNTTVTEADYDNIGAYRLLLDDEADPLVVAELDIPDAWVDSAVLYALTITHP